MANVRSHFDVFERARNIYLAQIKKAEFDYYERIKRATAFLADEAAAPGSERSSRVVVMVAAVFGKLPKTSLKK